MLNIVRHYGQIALGPHKCRKELSREVHDGDGRLEVGDDWSGGEVSCFFFSSRRRHTRLQGDWSSDVCSSDLTLGDVGGELRVGNDGPDAVGEPPQEPGLVRPYVALEEVEVTRVTALQDVGHVEIGRAHV